MTKSNKILATLTLLCISNQAVAKWVDLQVSTKDSPVVLYAAEGSLEKVSGGATLVLLADLRTPEDFRGKQGYSIKSKYEFDCKQLRFRRLSDIAYSKHMAGGEVVGSSNAPKNWDSIELGTALFSIRKMVCD
jgi:hypothetical protein